MKVGMVALHYPRREHWDEMISRVRQAAKVMTAAAGCLAVDSWVSEASQAVVTIGQWESEEVLRAGSPTCGRPTSTSATTSVNQGPEAFKLISA